MELIISRQAIACPWVQDYCLGAYTKATAGFEGNALALVVVLASTSP